MCITFDTQNTCLTMRHVNFILAMSSQISASPLPLFSRCIHDLCRREVRMASDEGDHGAVHDVLVQQSQAAVVGHGELVASVAGAIPASSLHVIFFSILALFL
jgi:hypothetical protein